MDSSEEGECTSSVDDSVSSVCSIRKRRFSNARIQPTRVKKVMQSDEDIGRMVASVPVAIGSAMEYFARKLLVAAAACVPNTTSRTLSPMHIKYAVMKNPHFSFLEHLITDIKLPKNLDGIVVSSSNSAVSDNSGIHLSVQSLTPLHRRFIHFDSVDDGGPSTSTYSAPIFSAYASDPLVPASCQFNSQTILDRKRKTTVPRGFSHVGDQPFMATSLPSSSILPITEISKAPSLASTILSATAAGNAFDSTLNNGIVGQKRKRGRPPRNDRQ